MKKLELPIMGNFHHDLPPQPINCPFCDGQELSAVGGYTHRDDCQNPIVLEIRRQNKNNETQLGKIRRRLKR